MLAGNFYFSLFARLDAFGLIGPDEPRYASVAREMAESGDWVTPRLNGEPWFEKPVLYYWSAAVAFRLLGVSEFSARLPSAIAALLAAGALAWLAWRLYGAPAALAFLLTFPTCVGVFAFARAATTDMPFSAALALAMLAAFQVIRGSQADSDAPSPLNRVLWQMLFGALLGVAALAKGPAAVVLGGGSVALWALASGRWKQSFRLAHPFAILAFCIVALPWYVLCALRNADFVQVFLISHNVARFLTPVFQHEQPFWFFAPVLLLGLAPWSALLAGLARDARAAWRDPRWKDSPGFFFACWAIFPFLFFSASRSKLPGYILPIFAPLVLLLVRSLARAIEEESARARWLCVSVGLTLVALAASAGHWLDRLPPESSIGSHGELIAWTLTVCAFGLLITALAWCRRCWLAMFLAAVLMASLVAGVARRIAPRLDPDLSSRTAAELLAAEAKGSEGIAVFELHRAWHYGLNFYFHRELPKWEPATEPTAASRPQLLVTSAAGLDALRRSGAPHVVLHTVSRQAIIVRLGSVQDAPE